MKTIKFTLVCFMLFISSRVVGTTYYVPDYRTSIQSALNAVSDGDTILVAPGIYFENIVFSDKTVVLASHFLVDGNREHIANTIIDGSDPDDPDKGTVVDMGSVTDTTTVLCGFTIRGGTGTLDQRVQDVRNGGGIFVSAGKIVNNIIRDNLVEGSNLLVGGGIASSHAYTVPNSEGILIIRNNIIYDNELNSSFSTQGAGVCVVSCNGLILIEGNEIFGNSATTTGPYKAIGGGLSVLKNTSSEGKVIIRNNRIHQNEIYCNVTAGAGIYILGWFDYISDIYQPMEIYNNLIYNNYSQEMGGGIGVWYVGAWNHPAPVDPIIFNNTIVNNEARIGAGISNIDAEIVLFNNIIWNEKEQYQDSEILNELTNYCPYWCRDEFNGIIHSDYNSLSDPEVFDACNNCNPSLSDSFCPCEQNYNIGHGTNSFEVNGDVYSVSEFDYYRNARPNPVDQFVDIGAVESGFLQGHDCVALSSDNHQLPESLTLRILPNPASEFVRITNLKGATTSIKIYNHVGRQVYACEVKESVRIDLSDFAPGMYFITTGDWSICEKLIVM